MYAVFRETMYAPDKKIEEIKAFKEFQDEHAKQPGYIGTVVTNVGEGRYLTVTLWENKKYGRCTPGSWTGSGKPSKSYNGLSGKITWHRASGGK